MARRLSHLTLILFLGLAGCGAPEQNGEPLPHPSSLRAPQWTVGQHWEYLGEHGQWHNWTVQAAESYNGRAAYRVQLTLTPPDSFGLREYVRWYDPATLGGMAEQSGGFRAEISPPHPQIFPMEERNYTSYLKTNVGYEVEIQAHYQVDGWEQIEAAEGSIPAVKVHTFDARTNQTAVWWYSEEAGGFAAYYGDDQQYFRLFSWGPR